MGDTPKDFAILQSETNIEILQMTGEVHRRNKYFHATNN